MARNLLLSRVDFRRSPVLRFIKNAVKRLVAVGLAVYFIPVPFLIYFSLGLLDFIRNRRRTLAAFDRYFAGNGFFTWLLAPFNLLMDGLTLPYRNRGIYQLADLPAPYQEEIKEVLEAARQSDLVGKLQAKMEGKKRGMFFFKWYGKNVQTSVDVPEFHQDYQYVRTIGVSIFSTKQSTGKHFGPLRVTLRVLYNINDLASENVYIKVGGHINRWRDSKLFIFDDTLEHQSCNESDEVRYCMFVDVLRPSLFPGLMRAILACVRVAVMRFNFVFYKDWVFMK